MERQMENVASKHDRSGQIVALLGPLIGLFTVILAKSADLGTRAWIPLTIIAAVSIYVVFGQTSVGVVRKAGKAIRHYYLVPSYLGDLEGLVKRLKRLCDHSYSDNIPYVLRDYQGLWGSSCRESPAAGYLIGLVDTLLFALSGSRRTKMNLVLSLRWFQLVLNMYDQLCVCEPVREINNHVEQGLEEGKKLRYERLRREYNKTLRGYAAFLEDWAKLVRDMNVAFGETLAGEYFARPEELSEPTQWISSGPTSAKGGNAGSSSAKAGPR
jgi:hypothetical protein